VTTPHGSARVDPLPLVVGIPKLRCTGQNPQDPQEIGGQGGGSGNGAVGNGDGHVPFTGFPLDEGLAAALVLLSCGALLVTASRTRRRVV